MDDIRAKVDWFKAVILPHEAALRARLRRIAPDQGEVDDLAAEVLTRAFANPAWRGVDHGRAYLFTIARNLVIDLARRDKIVSFVTMVELDLLRSDHDFEALLCARDTLRHLHALVEALPVQCRRAFTLRRLQEKSLGQIAEEMGLSVSTVEKHLGRAIRLLMQGLAEREEPGFARSRPTGQGRDRGAGGQAADRAAG